MIKIGLTLSIEHNGPIEEFAIPSDYISSVIECGALPVLIPPLEDKEKLEHILAGIDGIIMTGGDDISPEMYGEKNKGFSRNTSRIRDEAELYILGRALESGCPVLGICRGFQLINVYFGGTLYQDLETQFRIGINHRNLFMTPEDLHHEVRIEENTQLFEVIRCERFMVNSRHHQGIKEPGQGLVQSAHSSDGIIEGIEHPGMNIIAVQWHPENLARLGGRYNALFIDLIHRCEVFRERK